MGRSAKIHKRIKRPKSSVSSASQSAKPNAPAPVPPPKHSNTSTSISISTTSPTTPAANIKRRTKLKEKVKAKKHTTVPSEGGRGHVLGGADYVELMMGSRRRAREEAAKLPSN